jgi:uncharacterized protein (DUF1800 family)
MRKPLVLAGVLAAIFAFAGSTASTGGYSRFEKKLPAGRQIVHALNRLTYGPRPGDLETVQQIGLKKWIERQLHPETIPQDRILEAKLAPLDSLRMTPEQLVEAYPPRQVLRAVLQGKQAVANPQLRAALERLAQRLKVREGDPQSPQEALRNRTPLSEFLTPAQIRTLRNGTPEERQEVIQRIPEDKLDQVVIRMPQAAREQALAGADPATRRKMMMAVAGATGQIPASDLTEGKLYRAVYSTRQLEEQMVDFWFNHFNVYLDKGADRILTAAYERDAIRPHVLGRFRNLLGAVAQSPAMLFYLDNWQSVSPDRVPPNAKQKRGLNENYARELMELHTLGVDGGYTQKDVTEVARCFTGWTIRQPNLGGEFFYNDRVHDKGSKVVLGVTIPAYGGREDAEKVLDILASHPSTARFISTKLAQKFVSDDPPPALIERMARTFRNSGGDIRQVMETMLASPEFFSEGAWQAKIKTPLEMAVSAVRVTGADLNYAAPLAAEIAKLGQPLYRKVEPTGYSGASVEWVSSAALIGRMNLALKLAGNQMPGVQVEASRFPETPADASKQILFREPSPQTLASIEKALANTEAQVTLTGLVLGSPDFQRR